MDEKFSIFNIFTMLGGLAFFLYGMNVMSTGLEKLTGGKLEIALKKMTSNKFMAILLGMIVTIAIQSSSAMTVMLVGFVNSGIMALEETIAVCFGSNIGTTFTAWILLADHRPYRYHHDHGLQKGQEKGHRPNFSGICRAHDRHDPYV